MSGLFSHSIIIHRASNDTALSKEYNYLEFGSRLMLMTRFGENTARNCNTKDGSNLDSSQRQGDGPTTEVTNLSEIFDWGHSKLSRLSHSLAKKFPILPRARMPEGKCLSHKDFSKQQIPTDIV